MFFLSRETKVYKAKLYVRMKKIFQKRLSKVCVAKKSVYLCSAFTRHGEHSSVG